MNIVVIPDLHGKDCWQEVKPNRWDRIVFLADYVDSFDIGNVEMLDNLKNIIEFKKQYPDKVILLLGNHDVQYLNLNEQGIPKCSGYRPEMAYDLHILFKENKDLFQTAYQIGNHLFSHAGISDIWYNKHKDLIKDFWERISDKDDRTGVTIADVLNGLSETRHRSILHEIGEAREGARGNFGGPFWACYNETKFGVLSGYHQVVGHTARPKIERIGFNKNTSITFCDTLDTDPNTFLELEINE